jgi:hypothetical protein
MACDPEHGMCNKDEVAHEVYCTCEAYYECGASECRQCTAKPTASPTVPTNAPTSAPTDAPTIWEFFGEGVPGDDQVSGTVVAASAAGGLSVLLILLIVGLSICAALVVLFVLFGGTGLLLWKRTAMKLDHHAADFEGELVQMHSVPQGRETVGPGDAAVIMGSSVQRQENPIVVKKMISVSSFTSGI